MIRFVLPAFMALVAGCAVGPDYVRPATEAPAAFAEQGPWKVAAPRDSAPKAQWWKVFADPDLDSLEAQAEAASPTLKAALARYDAALAFARVSRAALLPTVGINASGGRELYSGNRETQPQSTVFAYTANSFDLPLDLTYEIDLFGQARRSLESARAAADAQGATYRNVLLTLQAGVAQNYFTLCSLLTQKELLEQNVALLSDTLELVRKLRMGGANSDLDLYQAEAQLEIVRSAALAVDQTIAEQRHGLAVLVGRPPEGFVLEPKPGQPDAPAVPVGLPSDLLERRPDIAAAERTMAAESARIGVAKAAFFPSVALTAFAGTNSSDLSTLLKWSSREWAVGPLISLPLFSGGATLANYREAQALYEAAVGDYRQQVLVAFQEVEDGLSDLRYLSAQADVLARATDASRQATGISTLRYKSGLVSYLEVIDAERTQLQAELSLAQIRGQRLSAAVLLIKALGGGW